MEIIKLAKSVNTLSGNPMPISFFINPWNANMVNQNIYIIFSLYQEADKNADSFLEVYNQKLLPSTQGEATIDVSSIVNAFLEYHVPDISINEITQAVAQIKTFKISATIFKNDLPLQNATHISFFKAMKGGGNAINFNPEQFKFSLSNTWFYQKKPLYFSIPDEKIHATDVFFLFFVKHASYSGFRPYFELFYEKDGLYNSTTGYLSTFVNTDNQTNIFSIPAGYNQSGISSYLPTDATAIAYAISVKDNAGNNIINPVIFTLYQSPVYETKQLLYRNSIGGLSPLRIYGQTELSAKYEFQFASKVQAPSYIIDKVVENELIQSNANEQSEFKGNTGWITKAEADRLRDFLISPQKFEVVEGKLIPIKINADKFSFYTTDDGLINCVIEWGHSINNKFYTPVLEQQTGCPAVNDFKVMQYSTTKLKVIWALPQGYNKALFTVTASGQSVQSYNIEGNSGVTMITIQEPTGSSGTIEFNCSLSVVCSSSSNGSPSNVSFTWNRSLGFEIQPIVITKYFNPSSLPLTLTENVNDYLFDNEGRSFEIQAGSYGDGGSPALTGISITSAGVIKIDLWNISGNTSTSNADLKFPNGVEFPFFARPTGATQWQGGTILVSRKNIVVEDFIYVKAILRNIVQDKYGISGDVFIETFSDSLCNQPLVVSALTVSYSKTINNWLSGSPTAPIVNNYSVTLKNSASIKIASGRLTQNTQLHDFNVVFKVLPGAGYVQAGDVITDEKNTDSNIPRKF